ncbi:MAG: MoxR family ATPase, partial [Oscillospiraceae bacterium]|nr:MoxR family ATPase [Oscillospiraceae bacterium]
YLYLSYPDLEKEVAILQAKLPNVDARLAVQVAQAVQKLRASERILKKPSIAETLDWAAALDCLGVRELTPDAMRQTAGFVLKNNEDLEELDRLDDEAEPNDCSCAHGGCHHHHHHGA